MTLHFVARIPTAGFGLISDTAVSYQTEGEPRRIASAEKVWVGRSCIIGAAGSGDVSQAVFSELDRNEAMDIWQLKGRLGDAYKALNSEYSAEFLLVGQDDKAGPEGRILSLVPAGRGRLDTILREDHCTVGTGAAIFGPELCHWLSGNVDAAMGMALALPNAMISSVSPSRMSFGLSTLFGGLMGIAEEVSAEIGTSEAVSGPWHMTIVPFDGAPIHQVSAQMWNGTKSILGAP